MKVKTRLLTILTLTLFVGSILSALPIVSASVGGSIQILRPDLVAPGGPVELNTDLLTATGGTVYFYLSLDDDPVISSGDVYFASVKTADVSTSTTVFLPTSISAETYNIKATDLKSVGYGCVVSGETIDVVTEGLPTLKIEATSGSVGDYPNISIDDATDYATVEVYWMKFEAVPSFGPVAIVDDKAKINTDDVDEWAIPNAYKGLQKIILYFDDTDTLGMVIDFTIKPSITVSGSSGTYSLKAETNMETFTINGKGFAKGTIDQDSITATLKKMDGTTIDTYDLVNPETDVVETAGNEGTFSVLVRADGVSPGVLSFTVMGESFADKLFSSKPQDPFTSISDYKVTPTEGINGDKLSVWLINVAAGATIDIDMIGSSVTNPFVAAGAVDANGAYKIKKAVTGLPGDTFTIRAIVTSGLVVREKSLGTFLVKPDLEVQDLGGDELDAASVTDPYQLYGTGFPVDATTDSVTWGTKKIELDEPTVPDTGEFTITLNADGDPLKVPHISGGGKDVTVAVKGEDADGNAISVETTVTVDPMMQMSDLGDYDPGALLPDGTYEDFAAATILPGHIVSLVGFGFLAGESVTVKLYDADDKLVGAAEISSGASAQSDGDIEAICWLPATKTIYPAGKDGVYLTVDGSTATNNADTADFNIAASTDATAMLFFGVEDDGDLDFSVKVGDTQRIVGVGFGTKTFTLMIDEDDQKDVTTTYGKFDTTLQIPELQGHVDGLAHEFATDIAAAMTVEFKVKPKITLTPTSGYLDAPFTVNGSGFEDDTDVALIWAFTEAELDTVDGADVDDGSFSMEVTPPVATPQAYKVSADVADVEWASATYTVLDKAALDTNRTLTEILAKLNALNIPALTTKIDDAAAKANAAATAATAAGTKADAATAAANAAKASADAATAAAGTASTKSDAATTAANAAKAAADAAAASSQGLTTLVYVAIAASVVAALAAIYAVMQITKKIA